MSLSHCVAEPGCIDAPGVRPQHRQAPPSFLQEVIAGLTAEPKTLPCKYLYDEHGSKLFDAICELPEYYLTRTELNILRRSLPEISAFIGRKAQIVEYGSGCGFKTKMLLHALDDPTGCAMIEISPSYLKSCVNQMQSEFPYLQKDAVCADFTRSVTLSDSPDETRRRVAFFPGSTIGNFNPGQARDFLVAVADTVGTDGGLVVGVDLLKRKEILEAAYDDAAGVTAEFNLNILRRINRELGANFQLSNFTHTARYNETLGRVEMHLVAQQNHIVKLGAQTIQFWQGESIHTENSYKYTAARFKGLAASAGWNVERVWTDEERMFSVQYLTIK